MPRPSNRAERRAQIVGGLMNVLPKVGYERATVARIAKAAGLSTGLLHHHFESKQEMLLALGEHLDELIAARVADSRTPRRCLHAYLDAHLALNATAAPEAVACWVALGAEAIFQPEVGALYRSLVARRRQRLLELLSDVCRDEGRKTRGLDVVAATLLAAIEGFFQLSSAAPDTIPRGSAASAARSLADKLLDAHPTQ